MAERAALTSGHDGRAQLVHTIAESCATDARSDHLVYFIESVGFDAVKIGWALDPQARLVELQCGCPLELRVRLAIPGGVDMEVSLHRRFRHLRIRGEWFRFNGEIAAFVAETRAARGSRPLITAGAIATDKRQKQLLGSIEHATRLGQHQRAAELQGLLDRIRTAEAECDRLSGYVR